MNIINYISVFFNFFIINEIKESDNIIDIEKGYFNFNDFDISYFPDLELGLIYKKYIVCLDKKE